MQTEFVQPEYNGGGRHAKDGPSLDFISADIGDFITRPKTAVAREYQRKTAGALNVALRYTAARPSTIPDAAAIIAYGDGLAAATGELAEHNEKTRQMIDLILTPESPYLAFLIAALPLATQLFRNHETSLSSLPAQFNKENRSRRKAIRQMRKQSSTGVSFTIPLLRKKIRIPLAFRVNLGFLRGGTLDPDSLSVAVFSNEQVAKALKKRGIEVAWPDVPTREHRM